MNRTRLLTNMLAGFFLLGITCVSAKSNSVISTNNSYLDVENPVVEEHDGVPAIMLSFTSTASTPQQTDGTMGTITVKASGIGTIMYKLGVMGTWQTKGSFTGLTAGTYTVWAKDGANPKGIATSITVDYVVHIPDANFKAALVANSSINTNADGEIQVTEAEAKTGGFSIAGEGVSDLTGLESFINITSFACSNNSIAGLDVEPNMFLEVLICDNNNITELDVSNNIALDYIQCQDNLLTNLNVANGNNDNFTMFRAYNNDLTCITVDDPDYSRENWDEIDAGVSFSLDCSDPPPVISTVDSTHIEGCHGDSTGTITINVTGGVGTITYSIDSGLTWQSSNEFIELPADEYNVKAKDDNGYIADWIHNPVTILEPDTFYISDTSTKWNEAAGTGSITVTVIGGQPPYEYKLDDGSWDILGVYSSLTCAIYRVYARDANLCIDSSDVYVGGPVVEIPDANFKAYLVGNTEINTNGDAEIQVGEAEAADADTLDVSGLLIADLTGIESFINLIYLNCMNNLLTSINLSENVLLEYLRCDDNDLTSLDVTNNTLLDKLYFNDNELNTIDLTSNEDLAYLFCRDNLLTALDLSNNADIRFLDIAHNRITEIDLSNQSLMSLDCTDNLLTELDVSGQNVLRLIACPSNDIGIINLPNSNSLLTLNCSLNELTELNVSANTGLETLNCRYNSITELDLSENVALTSLLCNDNLLADLDLRNGNNENVTSINSKNNPDLACVNVDDVDYAEANWASDFDEGVVFSLECNPGAISIDDVAVTDVTGCYGDSNGAISVTASGGTGALSYSIDEGDTYQSSGTFSSLSAGSYNVVVKDEADDSVIWSSNPAVVSQPDELSFDVSYDHPQCIGSSNGEINIINTSGGTGTYLFSVDGGVTYGSGSTFSGLAAGSYNLYVKDDNDCEQPYSANPLVLSDPSHDTISFVSSQNVTGCAGDETGIIVLNGDLPESAPLKSTKGVTMEFYSIDGGETWQSNNLFENLPAGEYTAVVEVDGCEYPWCENPVVINEPDSVIITAVDITADTGSSSGEIDITAEGGSNTFTYSIDGGSTFFTNSTFTGLAAGEYTVVVQDSETCQADSVVTVPDVSIEISDVATTDVTGCYGNENGSITITASGGDGTLSYSIDDGETWQTSDEFTGLAAGSYNVRVKDGNEDEVTWAANPVVLVEPEEISFFVSSLAPNCAGESSGLIRIINNTGGTGAFNFSIDGGVTWDTDSIFINLPAGSYNIVVRDANGCEKEYISNPRMISDPDPLEIGNVQTTNNTHCSGDGNGTIQISLAEPETTLKSANGLAPVYYYSIDDGVTWHEDTSLFENLSGGTYNVWAMNENQCTDEWDANPVVIDDVSTLDIDTFRVADDDGTGTGEIEVIVTGGTTPYEYRLDDGAWQTLQLFESLFAGTYLFQVSDSTGCEDSRSITVEEEATVPETETIAGTTFEDGDELCFGATLTITVGGEGSDSVDFEAGSSTTLIAGESITFLPGTHIHSGSYLWAFITTDGSFCDVYAPSLVETVTMPVKGVKEQTVHERQRAVAGVVDKKGGGYALKVFPNPNNGRFSIELSGFDKPAELVIYNSLGAVVKRLPVIPGNTTPVQLTLRQGIYYVKALSKEKSLYQKISIK